MVDEKELFSDFQRAALNAGVPQKVVDRIDPHLRMPTTAREAEDLLKTAGLSSRKCKLAAKKIVRKNGNRRSKKNKKFLNRAVH